MVRLLEASPNAGGRGTNINHPDSTANPASTPPTIAPNVGASSNFYASVSLESREEEPLLNPDAPDFFSVSNSCEGILSWPVFRDEAPKIDSFVFEDPPLDDSEAQCRESLPKKATQSGNIGRGIQEEDFIPLSRRFLNYIHVKNPILDINEFKCMVKGAADDGTRWDAPSCLVVWFVFSQFVFPFHSLLSFPHSQLAQNHQHIYTASSLWSRRPSQSFHPPLLLRRHSRVCPVH